MNDYIPPETDLIVAGHIERIVDEFLQGRVDGIAMVAMRSDGYPCRLYLNKTDGPILREPLQNLMDDYESGQQFRSMSNAPVNNRSHRTH